MKELEKILLDVFTAQGLHDAAGLVSKVAADFDKAKRRQDMKDAIAKRNALIYRLRATMTVEALSIRFDKSTRTIEIICASEMVKKRNAA